jgi:hypothetical protein
MKPEEGQKSRLTFWESVEQKCSSRKGTEKTGTKAFLAASLLGMSMTRFR